MIRRQAGETGKAPRLHSAQADFVTCKPQFMPIANQIR
jgi:hypothetical protein